MRKNDTTLAKYVLHASNCASSTEGVLISGRMLRVLLAIYSLEHEDQPVTMMWVSTLIDVDYTEVVRDIHKMKGFIELYLHKSTRKQRPVRLTNSGTQFVNVYLDDIEKAVVKIQKKGA
jgi:hypothetical protein